MSVVHYKFKNNLEYKTLSFDGLSISLGDLKLAILSQNRTKGNETDLEVTNAQTKEAYTDNATQIPKNASVIVRRTRSGPKEKALTAAERPQSPGDAAKPNDGDDDMPVVPLSKLNKVPDLASANASEEDKIAAMMNQAGEDWDPASYAKPKGRHFNPPPRQPPPPHYMCFRCRKPGHWIQNCPKNNDPNYDLKIRRTTGIPKSFLRLADKPNQKGALLVPDTGQYAVPIVDHHAYEQAAQKKRATIAQPENEKPIPPEYFCPICKKIMKNAVCVPCCGDSFCNNCIEKYLLDNDNVCPSCKKEDVTPASIVVNKVLRQAIIKLNSSGFDGGGLSAMPSSPSAHRDGDQGKTATVPGPTITTTAQPVTSAALVKEDLKQTPAATVTPATIQHPSMTVAPHVAAAEQATVLPVAVPLQAPAALIDPRLHRPDAMTMAVPMHTTAPIHRPVYVVPAGPTFHHTSLVHPSVPTMPRPVAHHIPHPPMVATPRHPALPFAKPMMNEEEFYRIKQKLQETQGRRKRRKDDGSDRKSRKKDRSRSRRDRRGSPTSRRSPSDRSRKRSRSWTPSGSSSRSSWSQSWSKSPSRSYSRSKSRTPVNWDRSRSPSVDRKRTRHEDGRKRKEAPLDYKKRTKLYKNEISDVGERSKHTKDKPAINFEKQDTVKSDAKSSKEAKEKPSASLKDEHDKETTKEKSKTNDKEIMKKNTKIKDKLENDKLEFSSNSKKESGVKQSNANDKKTLKTANRLSEKSDSKAKHIESNTSTKDSRRSVNENKSKTRSGESKTAIKETVKDSYKKYDKADVNVLPTEESNKNETLKVAKSDERQNSKGKYSAGPRQKENSDSEKVKVQPDNRRNTKHKDSLVSRSTPPMKEMKTRSKTTTSVSPKHDSKTTKKSDDKKEQLAIMKKSTNENKRVIVTRHSKSTHVGLQNDGERGSVKRDLKKSAMKQYDNDESIYSSSNDEKRKKSGVKMRKDNVKNSTGKTSEKHDPSQHRDVSVSSSGKTRENEQDKNEHSSKKDRTLKSSDRNFQKPVLQRTAKRDKIEGDTFAKANIANKRSEKVELDGNKKSSSSLVRKCSISDLRDIVYKTTDRIISESRNEKPVKKSDTSVMNAKQSALKDVNEFETKDLREFVQSQRKKGEVIQDVRKVKAKDESRDTSPVKERKVRKQDYRVKTEKYLSNEKYSKASTKPEEIQFKSSLKDSKLMNEKLNREHRNSSKDNVKRTHNNGEAKLRTDDHKKSVSNIKHKGSDELLIVEKRSAKKYRKSSDSDETQSSDDATDSEIERKTSKKRRKSRRSSSEDSEDERKISRKRSKDVQEDSEDSYERPKKKKKKRSTNEEERRDGKRKKRKRKKKHRKHKHKKKSKRKSRNVNHSSDEESGDDDSDGEHDLSDDKVDDEYENESENEEKAAKAERSRDHSGKDGNKNKKNSYEEDKSKFKAETTKLPASDDDCDENYRSTADSLQVEVNTGSGDVSDDDVSLVEGMESEFVGDVRPGLNDDEEEIEELDYDEEDLEKDEEGEMRMQQDVDEEMEEDDENEDEDLPSAGEEVNEEESECDDESEADEESSIEEEENEEDDELNEENDEDYDLEYEEEVDADESEMIEVDEDVDEENELENDDDDSENDADGDGDGLDANDEMTQAEDVDHDIDENSNDKDELVDAQDVEDHEEEIEEDEEGHVSDSDLDVEEQGGDVEYEEEELEDEQDDNEEENEDEVDHDDDEGEDSNNGDDEEDVEVQEMAEIQLEHDGVIHDESLNKFNEEHQVDDARNVETEIVTIVQENKGIEMETEYNIPKRQENGDKVTASIETASIDTASIETASIEVTLKENKEIDGKERVHLGYLENEEIPHEHKEHVKAVMENLEVNQHSGNSSNDVTCDETMISTTMEGYEESLVNDNMEENAAEDLFDEALLGSNEESWNENQELNSDELYGDVNINLETHDDVECDATAVVDNVKSMGGQNEWQVCSYGVDNIADAKHSNSELHHKPLIQSSHAENFVTSLFLKVGQNSCTNSDSGIGSQETTQD